MIQVEYEWKRFWYPRDSHLELLDGGYVYKPDNEIGRLVNTNLVSLKSLLSVPCLILLGEPGIGKTHEMQMLRTIAGNHHGEASIWFDLSGYQTDTMLCEELFKSSEFQSWLAGTHQLHLFLDSLDEGLLTLTVLAKLLIRKLQKYPVQRLSLRIACRVADWPISFEEDLKRLWGEENVGVYQLAALRSEDVLQAVTAHGLSAETFLQEVDRREVGPLASKPLTLGFLLNIYSSDHILPIKKAELYHKGCQLLCEEANESRRDVGSKGTLDSEQRLALASRIAALMIFTNRSVIYTGIDQGNVSASDITLRELCGGREDGGGYDIDVNEATLKESLATGLFSTRGPSRYGWTHRTYAEYLAACYLIQHHVTETQIMSLLVHPGDDEKRLIPQLHETAAWLATMNPQIFRHIMQTDPEVLLRSDVATADEKNRADLVDAILSLSDEARSINLYRTFSSLYNKLSHPGLPAQLHPYLEDRTVIEALRLTAIDIVKACELQSLQTSLLAIISDASESQLIREEAAEAVSYIGDEKTKLELKRLMKMMGESDSNDQIKGYTLLAIWPTHMNAEELFAVLTPPKNQHFYGSYQRFLSSPFISHLQHTDLPVALRWVENVLSRTQAAYKHGIFSKVIDAIIVQAWKNLDIMDVPEALARVIVCRLERFDDIVEDAENQEINEQINDEYKRRFVLEIVLHLMAEHHIDPIPLLYRKPQLLQKQDVLWLIEYLTKLDNDEVLHRTIARLIKYAFREDDVDMMNMVLTASDSDPILAEEFAWLLKPVELGSPEAQKLKEDHVRTQQWQNSLRENASYVDGPAIERIISLLEESERENTNTWERVYRAMAYRPDGTSYKDEVNRHAFPNWKNVDEITSARMLECAKGYIQKWQCESRDWLGTNNIPFDTLVVYKTLQLLMQNAPETLSLLSVKQWSNLIPVILTWCNPSDMKTDHELMKMAYLHVPEEVIEVTLLLIERENEQYTGLPIIQTIVACWDERLSQTLLCKAKSTVLKPDNLENILRELLKHGSDEAKAFASSLITSPITNEAEQTRAILVAATLFMYTEDAGWSVLWPLMQHDDQFGEALIAKVAYSSSGWAPQQLSEDQLADLYIWLVRHYPPSTHPVHPEVSFTGVTDSIALWRNTLLGYLGNRGTFQACSALHRILETVPDLVDQLTLKWTLLEAQEIARRQTWIPPRVENILKLVNGTHLRIVQNGEQLLDAVIESLKRLETTFHDEAPAWRDVWDRLPVASDNVNGKRRRRKEHVYRPIDENDFSDYLKRHLDRDLSQRGVIVNREVVIRKSERTDLYVGAIIYDRSRDIYDTVSVIIEVKGCWNRELSTAMKEQLVDRYLKDNHCQHGLYVVGWFKCIEWDSSDNRKGACPHVSLDGARIQFDAQATQLSRQNVEVKALVIDATIR